MILCGLDPRKYTDVENVIIHAGLSSHIGDKRGLTGHERGDNTAVRKLNGGVFENRMHVPDII